MDDLEDKISAGTLNDVLMEVPETLSFIDLVPHILAQLRLNKDETFCCKGKQKSKEFGLHVGIASRLHRKFFSVGSVANLSNTNMVQTWNILNFYPNKRIITNVRTFCPNNLRP